MLELKKENEKFRKEVSDISDKQLKSKAESEDFAV
jgi:hypothetical protein